MNGPLKHGLLALTVLSLGAARPATAQSFVKVERGPLVAHLSFQGELQAKKSVPINAPEVPDVWVLTIDWVAADGTPVKKGDEVARFRGDSLANQVTELENNLLVAQAEHKSAEERLASERIDLELEASRREMLLERARLMVVEGVNLISKVELDKAKLDVTAAELEVGRAKEALKAFAAKRAAELQVVTVKEASADRALKNRHTVLERLVVRAPADGVAYTPFVSIDDEKTKPAPGKVLRPGGQLMQLPDLSVFQLHLYVRQRDAATIQVGDRAVVTLTARPEKPLNARVVAKEPFATTMNERMGTTTPEGSLKEIHVTLDLDAQPGDTALRPGGTARAELEARVSGADEVLRVPLAAVTGDGEDLHVNLADGQQRDVKLGRSTATQAEVLSGLDEGDTVRVGELTE